MLFNSLSFAVFFPVVVVLYYTLPQRYHVPLLLVASCVFYMAFVPQYILVLFTLITLDFFLAQLIEKQTGRRRAALLWTSVAGNIGMLFFFKYFNFFNINLDALADLLHWNYDPMLLYIALPLGLSFHIFQSLSYVIEVYRRRFKPERNYLVYALYVMFFPQLVAGPIERPAHLLPQMRQAHSFDSTKVRRGLERMLWGFFKKLVIADNLALIVTQIYSGTPDGSLVIVAAVLFTFQIYCDFSGYSDIAVGTALVLGYDIMENFNRPFASRSVAEFWRRWHISLSSWLRDYVYYPLALGGKRHSRLRLYVSLFASFVLIGLWHGANWTYVVFGALNGLYVTFGSITEAARQRAAEFVQLTRLPHLRHALKVVITFALFAFCLIFFRAPDLEHAWGWVSRLPTGDLGVVRDWFFALALPDKMRLAIALAAIGLMEAVQYWQAKRGTHYIFDRWAKPLRYAWYYALIIGILLFGYFKAQPFIYFQF